jgi:tripartite-type tricarboxylate transporter receptor subunit TctC
MKKLRFTAVITAFILSLGCTGIASAQDYPNRPVRIIVPYPAGGSNDIAARIVAQKLSERLGKQFLVEDRGGGGGNIGMEAVATAAPDGYTLLLSAPGPLTANYALFKNLPVNPATAFAPIALIGSTPIVLVANPSLPANNAVELVALAKAKPGQINYGSQGNGSSSHLAMELFKHMTNINLVHVPYRGAAPAMNDLIAGVVPIVFDSMPGVISQVRAGTIKALGIGAKKRSKLLPNVLTIDESVAKGYEALAWYGLVAPAATPAPVLDLLSKEVAEILKLPDVAARFDKLGIEPGTVTGAAFGKFLSDETAKWTNIIEISGIKIN